MPCSREGLAELTHRLGARNVQTEAMDTLLRLIRDVPGSMEYLRRHAA